MTTQTGSVLALPFPDASFDAVWFANVSQYLSDDELAKALVDACIDTLGLRIEQINVEFTQHAGDEMYHPMRGGLSDDWRPDEVDENSSRAKA